MSDAVSSELLERLHTITDCAKGLVSSEIILVVASVITIIGLICLRVLAHLGVGESNGNEQRLLEEGVLSRGNAVMPGGHLASIEEDVTRSDQSIDTVH